MPGTSSDPLDYAIGIMSGTSADGIDAVLLEITENNSFSVVATNTLDFPLDVQKQIRDLGQPSNNEIETMGSVHTKLAHLYYQAIKPLLKNSHRFPVSVIGCHGQTIRHHPDREHPFTIQIGNAALLAQLSNVPVVSDFRSADIAAGGQGAPLAPSFHQAAFAAETEHRGIINIGGISNLTHLPAANGQVTGFDTGPGNTLLDHWTRLHLNREYDEDANWAKQGTIIDTLLERLLSDSYFDRLPPKSTGLEYFNLSWLTEILQTHKNDLSIELAAVDVQTTLTALTATTISDQLNRCHPLLESAYVCGGGAKNPLIMKMLRDLTSIPIVTTLNLGIHPQWVEAAAFAWMAHRTLYRQPSTLPSVTGAKKETIAGAIYFS
ncbi:MAG: anhydro-N-acetylmuramic acid kinase [Gammaproteobacteria bacterium]|nr:anhydro-N-acetylmuramic acid kinase [Gammaproteobacteria bacterium]NKB61119.1 anhydro-N-acetylmuramic acid kinase [Gammaproteobacteria bacterium]